ncbi:hypothetical protein BBJ28_00024176 [Nothophytophthora sp. Chile5]|nr:hypothetical protein BBJ28_00024176 [Nothophytophthora sp. Chile5]
MDLHSDPAIREVERRRQECVTMGEYAFSAVLAADAGLRALRRDRFESDPVVQEAVAYADMTVARLDAAVRATQKEAEGYVDVVRDALQGDAEFRNQSRRYRRTVAVVGIYAPPYAVEAVPSVPDTPRRSKRLSEANTSGSSKRSKYAHLPRVLGQDVDKDNVGGDDDVLEDKFSEEGGNASDKEESEATEACS